MTDWPPKDRLLRASLTRPRVEERHPRTQPPFFVVVAAKASILARDFASRPGLPAPRSRSNQASTFRGTLKLESLVGTKFDVPDVSKMAPIGS